MKHHKQEWGVLGVMVLVGLVINLCYGESPTAAGWAQAWGSVIAVFAAIWISHSERRQAQRQEKNSTLAVINACGEFIQSIKVFIDQDFEKYPNLTNAQNNSTLEHDRRLQIVNFWATSGHHYKISTYAKALSEIPLHRLDSAKAVSALLELVIHIRSPELFENLLDQYFEAPSQHAKYQKTIADQEGNQSYEKRRNLLGVATHLEITKRQNLNNKLIYLQKLINTIRDELEI